MDEGGDGAVESGSQLKRLPKRKCWTTGNLERTSALYILIMPCRVFSFNSYCFGFDLGQSKQIIVPYLVYFPPSGTHAGDVVEHG